MKLITFSSTRVQHVAERQPVDYERHNDKPRAKVTDSPSPTAPADILNDHDSHDRNKKDYAVPISRMSRTLLGSMSLAASIGSLSTLAIAQPRQPASTSTAAASQSSNGVVLDKQGPGIPPVNAQQTPRNTNNREIFRVLGLSAQVSAPVTPSYNGDATYTTFGGQPGNGQNAILAQSINGSP